MMGSRCGRYMVDVKPGATRRHPPSLLVEEESGRTHEIPLLWIVCQEIGQSLLDSLAQATALQVSEEEYEEAKKVLETHGLTLDESGCLERLKEEP